MSLCDFRLKEMGVVFFVVMWGDGDIIFGLRRSKFLYCSQLTSRGNLVVFRADC